MNDPHHVSANIGDSNAARDNPNQASLNTLTQLHAELAGKIEGNRKQGDKLRMQMMQVEAVMKMLNPEVNLRAIAVKRRNQGNPWFKHGTLYRAVLDVLRTAEKPMTARQMIWTRFWKAGSPRPPASRR
ncbi:hypothetical protein [Bradyrhizobium sp.]|uniref:hypothetical protein n=1 Tax=Bradyrhizobium sp. TaxID=376 RepID=UPI00261645BD|nr:hypothetical protein [Bradyrhizobium sp.]